MLVHLILLGSIKMGKNHPMIASPKPIHSSTQEDEKLLVSAAQTITPTDCPANRMAAKSAMHVPLTSGAICVAWTCIVL